MSKCHWIYKDEYCGYTGPLGTCDKTLEACKNHFPNGLSPFGGFPSRIGEPPMEDHKSEPITVTQSVLEIISLEQLRALRLAGLVVVHQTPTGSMISACSMGQWPESYGPEEAWHRMVAESIRLQNNLIGGK